MATRLNTRSDARPTPLSLAIDEDVAAGISIADSLGAWLRQSVRSLAGVIWIARCDDLVTGKEEPVDVSQVDLSINGIEMQDREFVSAIRERREPNASLADVLPCYRVPDALEPQLRG